MYACYALGAHTELQDLHPDSTWPPKYVVFWVPCPGEQGAKGDGNKMLRTHPSKILASFDFPFQCPGARNAGESRQFDCA